MSEDNQLAKLPSDVSQLFKKGSVILFTCAATDRFPLLSVTENSREILGFNPSYFMERENGWSDRIHPEDKQSVEDNFKRVAETGSASIHEYRFRKKDGGYIWLRDEVKLTSDEQGKAFIFGASVHITERKEVELAVAGAKEQYKSLVNHIKDVVFTLDGSGKVLFLNKPWEARTGFTVKESRDEFVWTFFHEKNQPEVKEVIAELAEGERDSATVTLRCIQKSGEWYWGELYVKRLPGTIKDALITGTLIDVSEDVLKRRQMEELNEHLQERVEQHSLDLEGEIERRKQAEQELVQRLTYEKAITKFASLLLESTTRDALEKGLRILMNATDSDRVYFYKNVREGGELFLEPVIEIYRPGVQSEMGNAGTRTNYKRIPWWHENLSRHKIIHAQIDEIPDPEHKILRGQNVKSVLVLPVFLDQKWYGYIGFSDLREKRYWKEHKIALLKTAAGIVSAYEKRHIIENSLVEQRNYTETILDSLPSIYILMDENMKFVQWNSNVEKYTGYRAEELKGKSATDLIVPEEHEELEKAIDRVLNDRSNGTELTLGTKSGKEIPYFWQGYYIKMKGKNYFLCVGVDITQQKETEKELMDEQRFNEALIESLPGIFYMIDREGNYLRWNKNIEKELGYSSQEITQMKPADFYTEQEFERVSSVIKEVFEQGEGEIEAYLTTKEGEQVPYYLSGKLFQQHDEQYIIGVGYDISEQVEARRKLRRSEELFRKLFLEAPAAIAMIDADNRIQSINKSFEKLFGYAEKELLGKDIDETIVPTEKYENAPKMGTVSFDSYQKETKRMHKDGHLIDVYIAGIPVYMDGESVAGFGMYIDISEQKRYEEEIYSSLKEKHVLLQEIHHRVKNNLAVISGLIQLQIYETDDPVIQATLQESESRVQTMALIHEKLYQSQNLSRISCRSYIEDLVHSIRKTICSEKKVNVDISVEDVELNINKSVPLALLVNEVVTNAFKHAFEGREDGVIKVDLKEDQGCFEVQISDNGNGLPEDFSFASSDTLGMTLIHNFLQQLEADWEWKNGNGTKLCFTFRVEGVKGSSSSGLLESLD